MWVKGNPRICLGKLFQEGQSQRKEVGQVQPTYFFTLSFEHSEI